MKSIDFDTFRGPKSRNNGFVAIFLQFPKKSLRPLALAFSPGRKNSLIWLADKKAKKIAKIFIFLRMHLEIDVLDLEGAAFRAFMPTPVLFWLCFHSFRTGFGGCSVVNLDPQMKSCPMMQDSFTKITLCFSHVAAEYH